MTEMTLAQYRAQGGCVAFVPGDITHVYLTMNRTTGQTPDGGLKRESGPVAFQCDVIEGRRVVRLPHLAAFRTLQTASGNGSGSGLEWSRLNPELCQQIGELNNNSLRAGPVG